MTDLSMPAPPLAAQPSLKSELTPVNLFGDGTLPDEFAGDATAPPSLKAVPEAAYNPWPNPAPLPGGQ